MHRNLRVLISAFLGILIIILGSGAAKRKSKKSVHKAAHINIDTLKEGDFFFPKAVFVFEPGEYKKPFETSSYEVGMNRASSGRCDVEMITGSRDGRRALGQVRRVSNISTNEDTPVLKTEDFLKDIQGPTEELFESAVVIDEMEGIAFRNDDLKTRIPTELAKEPWIRVPYSMREKVSQSLFTHVWGYWGDIQKYRKKSREDILKQKSLLQPRALKKVYGDVERYLKALEKKGKLQSDQMTNFQVRIEVETPAIMKIHCEMEGKKKDFSLERLNRLMSPYYEVIPAEIYSSMDKENNLPHKAILPSGVEGL